MQAERHYQGSLRLLPGRPSTLVNLAATQLHLGCGTGLCGPLLRPLARHLTGIDLSAAFTAEAAAETDAGPGWRLLPSLRYAHARSHLLALARAHGFEPLLAERAPVWTDQRQAVDGLYLVFRRVQGR
ncbi:MAG TPA: hypothetical protein VIW70_03610 [Rubrivivax sp.]